MRDLKDSLSHVLWIGGATDAGKTTVTRRLAARHGWQLYHYDRHDLPHHERLAERHEAYRAFLETSLDERWVVPEPKALLQRSLRSFANRFVFVVEDLLALPSGTIIVAEGFGLLPALVAPLLSTPIQALFLVPTPSFKRASMKRRNKPSFAAETSDPQRAAENLFRRDLLLAGVVRRQARSRRPVPARRVETPAQHRPASRGSGDEREGEARAMKYGVVFAPEGKAAADPGAIRAFVEAVEGMGYAHLLAYEHVLGADPDSADEERKRSFTSYENLYHEPLVLFGYLAALTVQLELATGILILPQRQTVLVAKQAAEVDVLSGGRLRLGVAVGWGSVEYEGLGMPFHARGRRSEEQVRLLRELWTKRLVTFEGEFHRVVGAGINPLPLQRPIPLWMGGGADVVVRRIARMADGWFIPGFWTPAQMAEKLDLLRAHMDEARSDGQDLGLDARLYMERVAEAEWGEWLEERKKLGITHVTVSPAGTFPDDQIEVLRRFQPLLGAGGD